MEPYPLPPPISLDDYVVADSVSLSHIKPQFVTEGTPPFRILAVNQIWLDTCGYQYDEVIGKTASIIQGPKTETPAKLQVMAAVKKRQSVSVRFAREHE